MKLYELSIKYNDIYDLVEDEEADLELLADTLESIEDLVEEKFENIAKIIKHIDGAVETFKKEENRIKTRRQSMENKVKWLKSYMLDSLTLMNRTKIEAGTFVVRRQKSPKSVVIHNQALLDAKYLIKQEDKIDSKAIAKDMREGKEVAGADFSQDSYHIRIG